jgi:transposase
MIVAGQRLPILIATKPVDFRCGHQALALLVQTELKLLTGKAMPWGAG